MKKVLLALAAFLMAPAGHAEDIWFIATGANKASDGSVSGGLVGVDANTIGFEGKDRKAWVYTLGVKGTTLESVLAVRKSFRCRGRETATLQGVEYDPKTLKILDNTDFGAPNYTAPVPGTMHEDVLEFVCAQNEGQLTKTVGRFKEVAGKTLKALVDDIVPKFIVFLDSEK